MTFKFDSGFELYLIKSDGYVETFRNSMEDTVIYENEFSNMISQVAEWERLNITLKDGRQLENLFLYNGKYLIEFGPIVASGHVGRDLLNDYAIYGHISPFEKYDFAYEMIDSIETNSSPRRNAIGIAKHLDQTDLFVKVHYGKK